MIRSRQAISRSKLIIVASLVLVGILLIGLGFLNIQFKEEKKISDSGKINLKEENLSTPKQQSVGRNQHPATNNISKPMPDNEQQTITSQLSCDDKNDCTTDYPKDNECIHQENIPCCGNSICEAEEDEQSCSTDCISIEKSISKEDIFEKAGNLIPTEPDNAAAYCRQLVFITDRDECYANIAHGSKNAKYCRFIDSINDKDNCFSELANYTQESALCAGIISDVVKDSCYVKFIAEGDYSLCDRLSDNYLKETCRLLR